MKKWWIVLIVILVIGCLWFIENHYDRDAQFIKKYEKENKNLRLLAERRELQLKILTYENKLGIRRATPVDPNE